MIRKFKTSLWSSMALARIDLKEAFGRPTSVFTLLFSACMSLVILSGLLVKHIHLGSGEAVLGAVGAIVIGIICFGSIGAAISLINPFPAISQVPIMIIMSFTIIGSTAFFDLQNVPGALQGIARINPISFMCEVMRFGFCIECKPVDWSRLGILMLQAVTALGIAYAAAGRLEHQADL